MSGEVKPRKKVFIELTYWLKILVLKICFSCPAENFFSLKTAQKMSTNKIADFKSVFEKSLDTYYRLLRLERDAGHFSQFFFGKRWITYLIQDIMCGIKIGSDCLFDNMDAIVHEIFLLRNSCYFLEGAEERRGIASFIGCTLCAILYEKSEDGNSRIFDFDLWSKVLNILNDRILLQELIETLD